MTRVVVIGAAGLLGRELCGAFLKSGHEVIPLTRADVDLADPASLGPIRTARADIVINAAAWTDVDGCARDPDRAQLINGAGPGGVAGASAEGGALMIQVSTNEVFDGREERTYAENDVPNPINPYGASKAAGERAVMAATDRHLIVRTAWLFGPDRGFPARIRQAADRAHSSGESLRVVDDEWGNPTLASSLAAAMVDAAQLALGSPALRVLHLAGSPPATRWEWAQQILAHHPVDIRAIHHVEYVRASAVPYHAVLALDLARSLGLAEIDWRTVARGTVDAPS